jgi:DNA (cytosine-5)-methyltransferase 1
LAFAVRGREGGAQAEVSDVSPALRTPGGGSSHPHVLTYDARGAVAVATVNTLAGDHQNRVTDYTAVVVDKQSAHVESGGVTPTLKTDIAHHMGPVVCVTGPVTHSLTHDGADASEDGTGRGTPIVVGVDIAPTLGARDFKGPGSFRDGALQGTVFAAGRPRRLTPLECERLMAWPDGHTSRGIDERGREYALSDTARYRLCGNGIGSTQAEWIGRNLIAAEVAA